MELSPSAKMAVSLLIIITRVTISIRLNFSLGNFLVNSLFDCQDYKWAGDLSSGPRKIIPFVTDRNREVSTYCDQTTENGGWTVILNRESTADPREDFQRTYAEYETGFGDPNGEFWIGLQAMHELTSSSCKELKIEMEKYDGEKYVTSYATFRIGSADSGYVLDTGGFSSVPDFKEVFARSNGMKFTTMDKDQDTHSHNCAIKFYGGWWYASCYGVKLTGNHYAGPHSYGVGIHYNAIVGLHDSFKKASMKIRPSTTTC